MPRVAAAAMVHSGSRSFSLAEIHRRSACAAAALMSAGLGDGDVLAIALRNDPVFLESILAANQIGAYAVPVNWHHKTDEIRYVLADSGASILVIHSDLLSDIGGAIPEDITVICVDTPPEVIEAFNVDPGKARAGSSYRQWDTWLEQHDPLADRSVASRGTMVYTSGTTGRPKGVKRDPVPSGGRRDYEALRQQWFGLRPDMRTAIIGPLYHSVQASYALAALSIGGSVWIQPRFDAEGVLALIAEHRLTHLHLVPVMMNRLLQLPEDVRSRYDLSSLEFVIHGAAPCAADVKRRFIAWWGPIIHEYYGTSEAGMVSRCDSDEWLTREGTVGRPWPGRTVRIYDNDGLEAPPRTEGLVYMSLGLMPGFTYHNADLQRLAIERDGLITNGDIGYVDEDGYLFLCDRQHDVVISGGVNIYPAEIEAALATHPHVRDSAVFGVPDAEFGEALAAAIEAKAGHAVSADEVKSFLRERLAHFKVPRHYEFRSLPRDDSGKIFKRHLRDEYWRHTGRRI